MGVDDLTARVDELIQNISKSFHSTYSEVEWEDIRQELYLKLLSVPNGIVAEYVEPQVIRMITNWAYDYCEDELDSLYPESEDRYFYSREQIRKLIPWVGYPERWTTLASTGEQGESAKVADPAVGGEALATYGDLRKGWAALSRPNRELLTLRYGSVEPTSYEAIAEWLDVDEATARKRVSRALGRLQRLMGGSRPYTGKKQVHTNAAAQAITGKNWNGD